MILLVDPQIPGYRIERLIGSGGMASVYLAIQESLERPVALKVLDDPESAEYQERFLNEGRIIASLTHTNIVTVHDIGIAHRHLFISMEYVEGGDLRKHIREGIATAEAFEIVEKLGNALKLAHNRDVIHRDVKPANILFRTDGTPLLADFGIAKDYQRDNDLTLDGSLVGSPYYLSPEQARAQPIDGRADIYSLGIILFEMLTGLKPFKGESAVDTVFKHLHDPVPLLPEELVRLQWVIDRMLAKRPEDRFADAREMIEAFQQVRARGFDDVSDRIVRGTETVNIPTPTPANDNKRTYLTRRAGIGAVAVALSGLALGAWLYPSNEQRTRPPASGPLVLGAAPTSAMSAAETASRPGPDSDTSEADVEPAVRATGSGTDDARRARSDGTPAGDVEIAAMATSLDANARSDPATKTADPHGGSSDRSWQSSNTATSSKSSGAEAAKSASAAKPKPSAASEPKRVAKPARKPSTSTKKPKKSTTRSKTASRSTAVARAPPTPIRKTSRELEIERLLRLGRLRLHEGKLSTPSRDSALYYRDEVLALDPNNRQARVLGDDILGSYVELAESSLARGDYFAANRHIEQGLDVNPAHKRLLWLKENAMKQSVRGFLNVFQRSLSTTEPKAKERGIRPDN